MNFRRFRSEAANQLARFGQSGDAHAVTAVRMHDDEIAVEVELVARLIAVPSSALVRPSAATGRTLGN